MSEIFSGSFAENLGVPAYHSTAATGRDATMTDAQVAFPQTGEHSIGWAINLASSTNLWFHWRMHAVEVKNISTGSSLFRVGTTGTTSPWAEIRHSGTAAFVAGVQEGGQDNTGAVWTPQSGVTYTIDVNVRWTSLTLSLDFYVNGGLVSSAARAFSTANPFTSFFISNALGRRSTGSNPIYMSEFLMASASTLGARVQTLRPSSAGQYAQWAGSPSNVNDFDPLTGITANAPGLIASRVHTAALAGTVRAVRPWAYQIGAQPPRVSPCFRIGGTDYFAASPVAPGAANTHPSVASVAFATNPATGAAWTTSDLAAIDSGFRSEAAS